MPPLFLTGFAIVTIGLPPDYRPVTALTDV
jgi:hypothetical protein